MHPRPARPQSKRLDQVMPPLRQRLALAWLLLALVLAPVLGRMHQVLHLLELAARVLVQLALPRQDVQGLEQLDRVPFKQRSITFGICRLSMCSLPPIFSNFSRRTAIH